MKCSMELLKSPYEEKTIFQALTPSEEELARHPHSVLYIRNCFFKRLDTLTLDTMSRYKDTVKRLMFENIEKLLDNPLDASILPTWTTAADFQNLDGDDLDPILNKIYFNVNMDSSNKYLFAFAGGLAVTIKHRDQRTWLVRTKSGLPYKLKTLKKDLGIK